MILNPPHIIELLRAWQALQRHRITGGPLTSMLAVLFGKHLGQLTWPDFQRHYHLYLQSIPLDLARQAWGLNAAAPSTTKQP